jgi:mannose-6-phosphate isomerase-like protein (cupin superfamily)
MAEFEAQEIDRIRGETVRAGRDYTEFIRVPTLSVGLYLLPAGATDGQEPHTEDEIYHVLKGRARIRAGAEERDVSPGSTIFVAATVPHKFVDIREALEVLVVFAPAEGTNAPK